MRATPARRLRLGGVLVTAATVVAAAASLSVAGDPPAHAALAAGDLAAFDRFTLTGIEPDPAAVDRLWRWSDRHRSPPAADDSRAAVVRAMLAVQYAVPGAIAASEDWLPPLRAAADHADPVARAVLGQLLIDGTSCPPDPVRGAALLTTAADTGDLLSTALAGETFAIAHPGPPPQRAAGMAYLRRAATGGARVAAVELHSFDMTDGTPVESITAAAKLAEAADAGDWPALVWMGRWFTAEAPPDRRDPPRGFEYLRRAVADNRTHRPDLACELADLYDAGIGTPADPAAATDLYERAYTTTGYRAAGFKLVGRYTDATATPARASRAVAVLRQMADRGSVGAKCDLANLYQAGLLVDRDPAVARQLYRAAAAGGTVPAADVLRLLDAVTTRPVRQTGAVPPTAVPPVRPASRPAAAAGGGPTTYPSDLPDFWAWQRLQVEPDADTVARLDGWSAAPTHDPERLFVRATLHLGNLAGDRDVDGSVAALTEASDRGYPPAMASLGRKLLGGSVLRPDPARGHALLDRAAAANDPAALVSIGGAYLIGAPTFAKDPDRAMTAFLAAAAGQGDTTGLVGVACVQAERKDYAAAEKTIDPLGRNPYALVTVAGWYHDGTVFAKDRSKAARLMADAVRASGRHNGDILAQWALVFGELDGPAELHAKAAELFREAYALGSTEAGNALAVDYLYGTGVPIDPSRATDLLRSLAEVGDEYAETNLARQYLNGIVVPRDVAAARRLYAAAAPWGEVTDECNRVLRQLDLTPVATPATAP